MVIELIKKDFLNAFEKCDVMISPVSPEVAWKFDSEKKDNPLKEYLADIYTVSMALAWVPAISVPCWYAKPEDWEDVFLPVWLQIIWPKLWEEKIFEVWHVFEQANKEYIQSRKPKIF